MAEGVERRWDIYVCDHCGSDVNDNWRCGHGMCSDGGEVQPSDTMVEVMPVSDHEAAIAGVREERDTALLRVDGAATMRANLLRRTNVAETRLKDAVAEFEKRAETERLITTTNRQGWRDAAAFLRNQGGGNDG